MRSRRLTSGGATWVRPERLGVGDDWWEGLVAAPDGLLYGIPAPAPGCLIIDPHALGRLSERALMSPYLNKY